MSREEQARLVAYLNEDLDSCRFGILLALCTGIRIGELCALQWESVSTNDKAIRIAKTLQRLHDTSVSQGARTRIVIGPPKSDTSVRTIPMTEYATGLCRRMKPQSSAAYVLDRNGSVHGAADIAVSIGKVHAGMRSGGRAFSYAAPHICDASC